MLLAFFGALGGVFAVFIAYGRWSESEKNYKENQKLVQFDNPEDKALSDQHMNSPYTPVKGFQSMQRVDSIYTFALDQFKERKDQDSAKKVKQKLVERSRAVRDSQNLRTLQQINEILLILKQQHDSIE